MVDTLQDSGKEFLLSTARRAITAKASGELFDSTAHDIPASFLEKRGVFVTLHKKGRLRGCIGFTKAISPLYEAVISASLNAAFKDPRFSPVTTEELEQIEIEISILTPPVPIDQWEDIRLGTHGVILKKHGLQALFLPQVAIEQKWDLPTTLSQLSLKAGLKSDDWQEGAKFEVFKTIVFKENPSS